MVKNAPSNAGDTGSIPRQGTKIPCAEGYQTCVPQLESLGIATTAPLCSRAFALQQEMLSCLEKAFSEGPVWPAIKKKKKLKYDVGC